MESLLDSTDLEIINILKENARLSLREIARRLDKSVMTIQRRLKKMERAGVIKGYTVVVDKDKLGFKCGVCALVRVKTGFDPAAVGEEIAKIDLVESVNLVTGDYELTIIANCRDNKEAYHLLKKISSMEGVERVTSHIVLATIK